MAYFDSIVEEPMQYTWWTWGALAAVCAVVVAWCLYSCKKDMKDSKQKTLMCVLMTVVLVYCLTSSVYWFVLAARAQTPVKLVGSITDAFK
jgi:hypothetical protein